MVVFVPGCGWLYRYKNVGDALIRVAKEEGILTYWRGAGPTVLRAMVVSTTQLGTYDQVSGYSLSMVIVAAFGSLRVNY